MKGQATGGQAAVQIQIDVDFLGHPENKDAGIFEPSLDIESGEVTSHRQIRSVDVNLHGRREVMRLTVQREDAADPNRGAAEWRDGPLVAA